MDTNKRESRSRRTIRFIIFLLAAAALALLYTNRWRPGATDPPAARLLPDLPAYRQVEGQTITAYIGALSEGAALLAGQPQLAVTIGVVDQVIGCYQDVGGVRARIYSHGARPLEAGVVAVADEAVLNDPDVLFHCITPAALSLEDPTEMLIEPCAAAYTLVNENGTFYIIYAATNYSVCRDFCSALEGCTTHRAGG